MYYVYVLESLVNYRLYTGSTNDLDRRLIEHNTGISKYTKKTAPFELVYQETYNTRREAFKREMYLKTGIGREFVKKILSRE